MSKKTYIFSIFFLIPIYLQAQIQEEWVARYNLTNNSHNVGYRLALDNSGNIYVTGNCYDFGFISYDIVTIKYNPNGIQQWVTRYNGPANGHDWVNAIAVDNIGNVYVTGYSDGGFSSYWDYCTIKYNSSGIEQWVARHNGKGNIEDRALSVAIDNTQNVYVTGVSQDSNYIFTYVTIKYDANGKKIWEAVYDSTGENDDFVVALAIDNLDNVYVTGNGVGNGTFTDYVTIKYNSSGSENWISRYDGPAHSTDVAWAIMLDLSYNVYVTGASAGLGSGGDYATIKYNSIGEQQWASRYNGPGNGSDEPHSVAIDASGNVYVYGMSFGEGTDFDFATVKYNSLGAEQWSRRYDGIGKSTDFGTRMVLDFSGNVYVTGHSWGIGSEFDYATIKYDADGSQKWVMRYNGPGNDRDFSYSIRVDTSNNVYITGLSIDVTYNRSFATIKYSQTTGIEPISNEIPKEFKLFQNYPNPFNPKTIINYKIPSNVKRQTSNVKLIVYNALGKEVIALVNEKQNAGSYSVQFDATNLASGFYFYKIEITDDRSQLIYSDTKKMVVLK